MGSRVEISRHWSTSFHARTVTILPEMCSSELGKKPPKIYNSNWTLYPCGTDFSNIWLWIHTADVITDVKFQADFSKDLGDTDKGRSTQILVFPTAFDLRPYNSVTQRSTVLAWAYELSKLCSQVTFARKYAYEIFKNRQNVLLKLILCSVVITSV